MPTRSLRAAKRAAVRPSVGGAARLAVLAGVVTAGLVGCGGGGGGSDAAPSTTAPELPAGCTPAPFTIQLGAGDAKAAPFEVADAAAQRVSILPGKMAFDASEMAGLSSQADVSPLGAYTIYLTDGEVPRDQLSGTDAGTVADGSSTVAAVQILPAAEGGFIEGEVVAPTVELGYETRAEVAPLSAAIVPEGDPSALELTDDVTGTVTVLEVDDETICVDADLTIAGAQGGHLKGTVLAPVVRAGNSYFIT